MAFAFYDQMVVFDHVTKTIVVVAMARLDKPGGDRRGGLRRRPAARRPAGRAAGSTGGAAAAGATSRTGGDVQLDYRSNFTQAAVRGRRSEVRRVHPRRRHFPGGAQPAAGSADPGPSVRDLSHAAGGQSQPVHVLRPHAQRDAGGQLAGGDGAGGRRAGDRPPAGRHAPPRRQRGRRPPPGRGAAGRSQGAGRARHAGRPGPQRRGPGVPLPLGPGRAT